MRIVTWNINSVRLRIDLVCRLLAETAPDILCLQETKAPDETFPGEALAGAGYPHIHKHGMKGYNGVAIISRAPLADAEIRHWCERQDCRHAVGFLPGGVELHNIYVPAGGDIPDPAANPKFAHKLRFLDELAAYFEQKQRQQTPMIVVGDLNVAPLEFDVWSHRQLRDVVSHTEIEIERYDRWQRAGGFTDAVRHFIPAEQRLYTWWSYRNGDWRKSDRGRRLDHAWVTQGLVGRLRGVEVLKDVRDWPRTSDHVPVLLDMD